MKRIILVLLAIVMLVTMTVSTSAEQGNDLPISEFQEKLVAVIGEMLDKYLRDPERFDIESTEIAYKYLLMYIQLQDLESIELNYNMIPVLGGKGFRHSMIQDAELADTEHELYGMLIDDWWNFRKGKVSKDTIMDTVMTMYLKIRNNE